MVWWDAVRNRRYPSTCGPYCIVALIMVAALWKYHDFLQNGGLQEREIPAHFLAKSRMKRSDLSNARLNSPSKNTSFHTNQSWICSLHDRLSHLHAACHRYKRRFQNTQVKFGNQFIVDDRRKVIYCQVPHVGSTSVKKLLKDANINSTGLRSGTSHHSPVHPPLGDWSHGLESLGLTHMTRLLPRYAHYKKFVVVRHPFERVLSVYNHIIKNSHKLQMSVTNYLKATYNTGPTLIGLTFENFVSFLTDSNSPNNVYNNLHWKAITDTCFPCHINYNRVIKLETFPWDSLFLKEIMGLTLDKLPHLGKSENLQQVRNKGSKHIPQFHGISQNTMSKLKQKYKIDMDIFGYYFDLKESRTKCSLSVTNGCC